MARADSGSEHLKKEPLDLYELAEEACSFVRPKADAAQIEISLEGESGCMVTGDHASLLRVFQNLLENGVQYGKADGYVHLKLSKSAGKVICRFEDNGIGMEPEHLDKIWDRFYRVDKVRGRADGNSGLGLSIVKWIVEEHGGKITVESTPGEGSIFTLLIPEA